MRLPLPQAYPAIDELRMRLAQSESVQQELDRRVFNLKTLYDVSKDIFCSTESEAILRNFLLMVMGNFGVTEGVAMIFRGRRLEAGPCEAVGLSPERVAALQGPLQRMVAAASGPETPAGQADGAVPPADGGPCEVVFPFTVDHRLSGALGLGPKLIGEPYNGNDRELIRTLVNNLTVALCNARSIEEIKTLNRDLEAKNQELEQAMKQLQAAIRKVEILESLKSNLCKFVPTAVTRLMESSPTGEIQEAAERDISVLFLDIEGYTRITEKLGPTEVNSLTEKYFSVFLEAIYQNNGDVVETAGDGLMVLFMTEDPIRHALEAVRTGAMIREKAHGVNRTGPQGREPVIINIGICSGPAFVGASKFESYTGARWAYTSHGTTTNVAARLCHQATGGAILVSRDTAARTHTSFAYQHLGLFKLKNLSEEIEVFALA